MKHNEKIAEFESSRMFQTNEGAAGATPSSRHPSTMGIEHVSRRIFNGRLVLTGPAVQPFMFCTS